MDVGKKSSPVPVEEEEKPSLSVVQIKEGQSDKVVARPVFREAETQPAGAKRDWSGALDLINETYRAIRMADERFAAAEKYTQQLTEHFEEQIRATEARLSAAEIRASLAEARAKEAEEWLVRFHDTIIEGFQKTLSS